MQGHTTTKVVSRPIDVTVQVRNQTVRKENPELDRIAAPCSYKRLSYRHVQRKRHKPPLVAAMQLGHRHTWPCSGTLSSCKLHHSAICELCRERNIRGMQLTGSHLPISKRKIGNSFLKTPHILPQAHMWMVRRT